MALCGLLIMMGVMLAFAKVSSLGAFVQVFRLNHRPTALGSWGIAFGAGIALVALYFAHLGWVQVHDTALSRAFRYAEPKLRILLPIFALIGPFLEEPIMRGFLYPAFRGSYPLAVSVTIVVAMSLNMHPETLTEPGMFTFLVVSLNFVVCLIRENSNSLWDCILCHLAYNGTLALADIWRIVGQR